MAEISAQKVKDLREKSGAGMMDCKKALSEAGGDLEKAFEVLRKKGLKTVEKRAGKTAAEGTIFSYVHSGGRIGVMLELNSETDFVARSDDFLGLAKEISMHIAWANPQYVSREEVPEEIVEKEKTILKSQLKPEQEKMADKIVSGKIEKYFSEICLLEQLDAKAASGKTKIQDLVNELSAKVGEKINVRRFSRYEVGEGIEKVETDYRQEVEQAIASA